MLQSIVDKWEVNEKMGENLMVMLQSIVDKWENDGKGRAVNVQCFHPMASSNKSIHSRTRAGCFY